MTCRHDAPAVAMSAQHCRRPESLRLEPTPETPVVIPTTPAGCLDPVAVPNCLRIMEVLSLAITISGSEEE